MNIIELIKGFWEAVFSKDHNIAYVFTIATVFLIPIYALGVLKYFDALLYRVSQLFIRPFNLLIFFLDNASSSIKRLDFKYHVANFILVICAFAMLITEYALIQDYLESLLNPKGKVNESVKAISDALGLGDSNKEAGKAQIQLFGLSFSVSNVLSISYLSIATLLGFFIFELSYSFKEIYKKVLQPNETNQKNEGDEKYYIVAFLIGLILLALIQGLLGLSREEQMKAGFSTQALLTVTGFLIPIVAGVGLMSFHIFFAQIAMLLKLILQICKDLVIAICLKVIALVDFISALITKTIILFLGVSGDLHKAITEEEKKLADGKDKKVTDWLGVDAYKAMIKLRFLKRLAPVERDDDSYSIYILDKLDITSEYANAFWKKRTMFSKLVFVCEKPKFELEKKLSEIFLLKKSFADIAQEIVKLCQKQYKGKFDDLDNSKVSFWVMDKLEEKNISDIVSEPDYSKISIKKLFSYDMFLVKIDKEVVIENEEVVKIKDTTDTETE